ncbi:MAG: tRNA pseudouridine(38-40) synthase TruA [Halodesulfurarchaeum sp.]|nr:tRNA pseudouridine(38-40) synthase TruA [Halodesulfurarchaeum sp.]
MRAYRVAYDGRAYHGFQRQPAVPTVENTLFSGLRDLGLEFDDDPPGYAAAGRTDRGVSALAQTIALDAPKWLSPRAFTTQLPTDVHVWASADAPDDFHATHDAIAREYTYYLHVGGSPSGSETSESGGRGPGDDPVRIEAIESRLSGEHDFHNLAAEDTGTVRDLSVRSRREGFYRVIRVRTDGFPRQLVRRLVTLYDRVRSGRADLDFLDRVLGPEPLPGPDGIEPAPAHPLVLTDVEYGLDFEPDPTAVELAREAVSAQVRRDRSRATALESIEGDIPDRGTVDRPDNP